MKRLHNSTQISFLLRVQRMNTKSYITFKIKSLVVIKAAVEFRRHYSCIKKKKGTGNQTLLLITAIVLKQAQKEQKLSTDLNPFEIPLLGDHIARNAKVLFMDFYRTKTALHSETLTNVLKRYQNDSLGTTSNYMSE